MQKSKQQHKTYLTAKGIQSGNTQEKKSIATVMIIMCFGTAFLLVLPVLVLVFLGNFLDSKMDTKPTFLILGILIGSMGGTFNLFRLIKMLNK